MNEQQVKLVRETIQKNTWCGDDLSIHLDVWSNFPDSQDLLRTYLCNDGSGYIRGYFDGVGTFYVNKFHLRDEEWTEAPTPQA